VIFPGFFAPEPAEPPVLEARPLVGDVVRANLEPSYVAYAAGVGVEPLIFEANIAPHFSVLPRSWRTALFLTPKIVLRMFAEESAPVKTPSYMPRVTFVGWLQERLDGPTFYASLVLSHHSNGQSGPFFDASGAINHEDGSFGTNYFELAFTGVGRSSAFFGWNTLSLEWHPKLGQTEELSGRYGLWRLHAATMVASRLAWEGKLYLRVSAILDDFQPSSSRLSVGAAERFPVELRYSARLPIIDLGVFAGLYWGHDYYNIWFDRMVAMVLVGISGDLAPRLPPEQGY
jgi:hypothetical protein